MRTVTLADVQEFADFLSTLLAPASQARIIAALKSLFTFGHQVGYLPFDVGRPVKLPTRRDDRAERLLSADDVHSMIAHAKKGRDRTLVRTLYRRATHRRATRHRGGGLEEAGPHCTR